MFRTLLALAVWTPVLAYNPPVDTAGPLTVRIETPALGSYGAGGLAEFNRADTPVTVPVTVVNESGDPLAGGVRMRVVDRWKVSPDAVPFSLAPHARARFEFRVSFGPGTYNADYPLHAFAESGGHVAHAVMIVRPNQPNPPRARPDVPFAPVKVAANSSLALWKLAVRRVSERIEDPTAGARYEVQQDVEFGPRDGIVMHLGPRGPGQGERVAAASVTYPLQLPDCHPLRLRFGAGGSAKFRVLVDDATVAEKAGELNLDTFAGKSIRLELEAEGSGAAWWTEPTVVAGTPSTVVTLAPRTLGQARITPGARGLLDAKVDFGRVSFQGFRARVLGDQCELVSVHEEPAAGHYRVRHHFYSWAGEFDLIGDLWWESGALRASFRLDNPPKPRAWVDAHIEQIAAGPWSLAAERIYAGPGNVISKPEAFTLGFDGHRLATSYVGFDFAGGVSMVQAVDAIPDRLVVDPAQHIYTLETPHTQTLAFIPAKDVWTAVKTWRTISGPRASAGVPKLAGRFVFDLWGGKYGTDLKDLEKAFRYGLTDAVVVRHNWQRWGYDYRLPDLYPPNPQNGSEAEFRDIVELCRKAGVLFAPHDNYIDFYPDSEGFTFSNIVFTPAGAPLRAWFNFARLAQSYRARPDKLRPFVERNVKLVRDGFAPTAYFIDVWSSAPPHDFWTSEGEFHSREQTRQVWGDIFAWIRETLGGAPQISEAGHDRLIGYLDGSQAQFLRVDPTPGRQFVWPVKCADAERIPWSDAAYHDIFIQHGAGYSGRYQGGLDERTHGIYSDDYITVEVLAGHPAMVASGFNRDVVRKYWLLHDLMRALALERIEAVEFAAGDLHRQHVLWSNGAEVWVNRGATEWLASGHVLPQYGFYARFPGGAAAIENRDGARIEWSRTADAIYENGARTASGHTTALP
jgi:hypothetical protein